MTEIERAKDVLNSYYDCANDGRVDDLPNFMDSKLTFASLSGSRTVDNGSEVIQMFSSLLAFWKDNGISPRMWYDREAWIAKEVQENVILIQTTLTHYTPKGDLHGSWNCTYVMTRNGGDWKITLATSDNRTANAAVNH